MSDQNIDQRAADGRADAFAATAIITIVVVTLVIWLSGMPA